MRPIWLSTTRSLLRLFIWRPATCHGMIGPFARSIDHPPATFTTTYTYAERFARQAKFISGRCCLNGSANDYSPPTWQLVTAIATSTMAHTCLAWEPSETFHLCRRVVRADSHFRISISRASADVCLAIPDCLVLFANVNIYSYLLGWKSICHYSHWNILNQVYSVGAWW